MKNIFTLGVLCLCFFTGRSQTDVFLKINHKLGTAPYSNSAIVQNNMSNSFQFQRLDYYISQIKLTYDGGQDTVLTDTYIMVKGHTQVNQLLGNFNMTSLESIEFGIGVDPGRNHQDISTYPTSHPLSFQSPSMHWGWAAGYRFAALEGKTGASMNQSWQVHALGDKNYGFATITTSGTLNNGNLYIDIDADYTEALRDITVSGSLNYHGEDQQAPTVLQNFQNHVFSEGTTNIGIEELENAQLTLSPNPSAGLTTLRLNESIENNLLVIVSDLSGRVLIKDQMGNSSSYTFELPQTGIYIVRILQEGQVVSTNKLMIQNR